MSQRTRAELRTLLLDAGADLIDRDGIGLELAEITYASVFDYLEQTDGLRVTRASVHKRIWPSQRDFQLEVVAEAVRRWDVGTDVPDLQGMVGDAVHELGEATSISDLLDHLCKIVGVEALAGWSDARSWRMFNALWTVFEATPVQERTDLVDFAEQVRETYRTSLRRDREDWQGFVEAAGMTLRPESDDPTMMFSMLSSGLLEGAYLTRYLWEDDEGGTPADGWSPFAIGLRAFAAATIDDGADRGGIDERGAPGDG